MTAATVDDQPLHQTHLIHVRKHSQRDGTNGVTTTAIATQLEDEAKKRTDIHSEAERQWLAPMIVGSFEPQQTWS